MGASNGQQSDLEQELAHMIVSALNLEGVAPEA